MTTKIDQTPELEHKRHAGDGVKQYTSMDERDMVHANSDEVLASHDSLEIGVVTSDGWRKTTLYTKYAQYYQKKFSDLRAQGGFGSKNAEDNASEWDSSATNVHGAASIVIPTASKPASAEVVIQKGGRMHQLDFTTKGLSRLGHGFPSVYDNEKEDAFCVDDSLITCTVDKYNKGGV